MSILSIFRKIDRNRWFVCHNCMMHTDHDAVKSIFYSDSPKVNVVGRPTMICPRCSDANTRSFQELKDEGSESSLWGSSALPENSNTVHFFFFGSVSYCCNIITLVRSVGVVTQRRPERAVRLRD